MMFKLFKDKVTKLVDGREELVLKRQKINDKKNTKNSKIEVKMDALQKKSWRNQISATTKIEEINRKLEKMERDIISEKEYLNSISTYKPEAIKESIRKSSPSNIPEEIVTGRSDNYERGIKKC